MANTNAQPMEKHEHLMTGEVVSTSMKDTIVVRVSRYIKIPKYGKYVTRTERFKVHDKGNTCALGEIVYIKQTKPISKTKHFIVAGKKAASIKPEVENE